jgi:putative membrane protein
MTTGVVTGIALGMVSGLLPGVHVNMMAGGLLAVQTALLPVFGPEMIAVAMVAALVTHSFLDSIPSCFLTCPQKTVRMMSVVSELRLYSGRPSTTLPLT